MRPRNVGVGLAGGKAMVRGGGGGTAVGRRGVGGGASEGASTATSTGCGTAASPLDGFTCTLYRSRRAMAGMCTRAHSGRHTKTERASRATGTGDLVAPRRGSAPDNGEA